MALNATTYSGKEFAVYIAADDVSANAGTFNDQAGEFRRLDVEGITLPTFNPNQEFEIRTGSGRFSEFDQVFSSTKRVVTEFTLSGRLTTLDLPIWIENALSKPGAAGSNRTKVSIPTGYNVGTSGASLTVKTDTTATDVTTIAGEGSYEHTLSVAFVSPSSGDGYKFAACVVTSLTLDADMDSAAGRFNFSATLQTAFQPAKGNMSTSVTIGGSKIFLSDLTTKNIGLTDYDGSSDDADIDPILKTFSLSIDNPTQFLGMHGSNGNPQLVAKGVPELSATISATVKYDNETDNIIEAHRDSGGNSHLQFNLGDIAWSSYAFADTASSAGFGVGISRAKFTSAEVTGDDVAMVSFEAKVLDDGTNAIIEVVTD